MCAAPTDPTLDTLTVEALKLSGYKSATAGNTEQLLSERWIEDLKNDIWSKSRKRLKTLQTSNVYWIKNGERLISCPSDFSSHIELKLLQCTHYGVCQAGGTTTTAKLASDEDVGTNAIGKEIVVWVTDATAITKIQSYIGYITDFNTTTKVVSISPAWSVSPDATYSYMIVDSTSKLEEKHLIKLDSTERGTPERYYPEGDNDYDQYYLDPVPYRTDSKPWAIRERYYSNLMTLDLAEGATTIMTKLYREWKEAFIQGVMWKSYDYQNDDRANNAYQKWSIARNQLISIEQYGADMTNLQKVVDY